MSLEDDYNKVKDFFSDKDLLEIKAVLSLRGINYKNIHSKMKEIGIKRTKSAKYTKEDYVKLFVSLIRKDIDNGDY